MRHNSTKENASSRTQSAQAAARDPVLLERIAEKAYELFQKRGSVHGHDLEDWLEAERLVLAETKAAAKTDAVAKGKTPGRGRTIASKSGSVLDRPRSA